MPESDVIHEENLPLTVESMIQQFKACGLAEGQTVMVHSAMSKMGWIAGATEAVIQALFEVVTPTGTLMMPAHTNANTDPAHWGHPPVPAHWVPIIRQHSPPFNPRTTPSRQMGAIAEHFRTWEGTLRSDHPVLSCCANGRYAEYLIANHSLTEDNGDPSPVGRLYELDGCVLLIGVGYFNNTSLHLAEFRADYKGKHYHKDASAMLVDGKRQWVEYDALNYHTDDFGIIGEAFEQAYNLPVHKVGMAEVRFMRQRDLVDFAVKWMEQNRDLTKEASG